jgi:RNA-directed DNA polymerase
MFSLEEVFEAYYDCRKNKRGTASAVEFEINYEQNCIQLWRELNDRTYKPSISIAFIVKRPRRREVFAANFRDRVLHHLVDLKLRPLLEQDFSPRTFNNRKGKGTSACVEQLRSDIERCGDCWVLKMDIKGFFMSISKSKLTSMICEYIDARYGGDRECLKWLISIIINDHPENNCELRSPWSEWSKLEKNKSLFYIDPDKGIPIGNLISQLLANFYMTGFDQFVTNEFELYGRYVDDFYIVTKDKTKALNFIALIRKKLAEIELTLHPGKFYCQHHTKGVEMVGVMLKKERSYVHNRTVNNAFMAVKRLEKILIPEANAERLLSTVNAYLGFMRNYNTYAIRRNLIESIGQKWWGIILIENRFNVVRIIKKYNKREIIKQKIKYYTNFNKRQRNGKITRNQQQIRHGG